MPPLLSYRLASPSMFDNVPLTRESGVFQSFVDVAGSRHVPPGHLLLQEAVYYALAAWAYGIARRRKETWLFLGLMLLGSCLEVVGVCVTNAHMHPRFAIMLFGFLPLKEALWYPLTLYPAILNAQALGLPFVAEASLVGLLQITQVVQYESMAYRRGIQLVASNPKFAFGNANDLLTGGPVLNMYANLAIAVTAGVFASQTQSAWVLGLVGFACVGVLGFLPFNWLKFIGCALRGDAALWPPVEAYSRCVQSSPVRETWVLAFSVTALALAVAAASPTASKRVLTKHEARLVVGSPVVYNALLGVVILCCDEDARYARGDVWCQFATLALAAIGLSFIVARRSVASVKKA